MAYATLNKVYRLVVLSVGAMSLAGCGEGQDQSSHTEINRANSLHERVLTIDSHVDISSDYTFLL